MRAALLALLAAAALLAGGAGGARAHALQPGYLELTALGDGTWRALWRKPDVGGRPMPIEARLPDACGEDAQPAPRFDGAAWAARWVVACPGGLAGGEIAIPGLEKTRTDVLVRYELAPGEAEVRRLTAAETSFVVPGEAGVGDIVVSYFGLGVEHILEGFDHLLFVFALLLLIGDPWRLLGAITAFTAAHSLTLGAAAMGWLALPSPPVEATIALSIMFVAAELLQRREGHPRFSERSPWVVAFAFGLLHGLGFAGALVEIGLPAGDVPLAVLSFNLGVEAGQLMFIAAVVAVAQVVRLAAPALVAVRPGSWSTTAMGYAIGGVSAFWFVERVAAF